MAIFGFKKRKDDKIDQLAEVTKQSRDKTKKSAALKEVNPQSPALSTSVKPKGAHRPVGTFSSASESIIRPRVTEKSGLMSQNGVYTFEVERSANKQSVKKAIIALYKVTPVKIGMVNLPDRKIIHRGRLGTVSGIRKAMVTVKKGEKIDFV